ncbi:hypothetical protein NHX12_026861, partial [Muraenolepis orangiensis]
SAEKEGTQSGGHRGSEGSRSTGGGGKTEKGRQNKPGGAMDTCYDDSDGGGRPSRCMPGFENAAFNRTVLASNACGAPPEDYCMQTGSTRLCHRCDAFDPASSHGAGLLTDFHTSRKAFEITYVRLKFHTSRPESFAIYKRLERGGAWLPYQYYSGSCLKTYGRDPRGFLRAGQDERAAACTDEFSDISPLTGGNVAFSTLEGRPSLLDSTSVAPSPLNTFGDEFFKDSKVLRSYFYAISDFSVGGSNETGHGTAKNLRSTFVRRGRLKPSSKDQSGSLACVCQHHTAGVDCQLCLPFYQDRPWARATGDAAHECLSEDNTHGPLCESCRENHYRASPHDACLPCNCNVDGSEDLRCDAEGVCVCRATVTGAKCDTCQAGFHSLGPGGCRPCQCDARGSVGDCSPVDGSCQCKPNVEGQACDSPAGCQACFCFGHSLACSASTQHGAINITSHFHQGISSTGAFNYSQP